MPFDHARPWLATLRRLLLVLAATAVVAPGARALAEGVGASAAPSQPGAAAAPAPATPARPDARAAAAYKACRDRADLLYVRRCKQACMMSSKQQSRVLQKSQERDECQLSCGNQPEMTLFLDTCMTRAGYPAYRHETKTRAPAKTATSPRPAGTVR